MKKLFLSFALMVAASAAFAVPNPKQVEQALERGNCAQARNLVNEVLAAKPDSARAHLLNSATIMCLERDVGLAQRELDAARELDRKGDVTSSNLFAKMEGDIAAAHASLRAPPAVQYTAPVVAAAPVVAQPAVVAKEESSGWGKFFVLLLLAAGAGAIYVFWRRSQSTSTEDYSSVGATTPAPVNVTTSPAVSPNLSTSSGTYNSRGYSAPPAPSYSRRAPIPAPAPVVVNSGPSALETGIAVAGGVVVGNAISEAMKPKHDTYSSSRRRESEDTSSVYSSSSSAPYTPPYVPPAPAPAPSVFSSSSDDGWGSTRSAPAPAPSSWSSSSDDDSRSSNYSSSSSSDYSSSSSSDSSSSSSSDSGSSDW